MKYYKLNIPILEYKSLGSIAYLSIFNKKVYKKVGGVYSVFGIYFGSNKCQH